MLSRILAAITYLSCTLCASAQAEPGSWLFVSLLNDRKIVTFERHPESGELTRRGETKCPAEPAILSCSPDQTTLFASFRFVLFILNSSLLSCNTVLQHPLHDISTSLHASLRSCWTTQPLENGR